MQIELPENELDQWIQVLKPYQAKTIGIYVFEMGLSPEDAAKKWLSATGSNCIVPFGGDQDTTPFWNRFKGEMWKFLCDDDSYVEEKKRLREKIDMTSEYLVAIISAALGANLGLSATLLAPSVVLILFIVSKAGLKAYCNIPVEPKGPVT